MINEPKILAVEQDKFGKEITIKLADKLLAYSPLCAFFLRQQSKLLEKGYAFPTPQLDDTTSGAVFAEEDGQILGHIVFNHLEERGTLWIILSAVDEDQRGRGIYTILHKYFEETAKAKGCWYISSHIHVDNHVRLKSAEKVGMKPFFYFMFKRLTND